MTTQWFWRIYATVYDLIWDGPATDALCAEVRRHLAGARHVVDLGCGTGLVSQAPADGAARPTVGVDTSAAMLARATRTGRIAQSRLAPAERTGLPDGSADAVIVCNLLHLHPDPAAVIAEAVRLARPGATIVLSWPVDGLTTTRLRRIERDLGRPFLSRSVAHVLRTAVGTLSSLTALGARAATRIHTEEAVFDALASGTILGITVVDHRAIGGFQRLLVLARHSAVAIDPEQPIAAAHR